MRESLRCPVSHGVCADPVLADDGITYERSAIAPWVLSNASSPLTRKPLSRRLVPNLQSRAILGHLKEEGLGPSDDEGEAEQAADGDPEKLSQLMAHGDPSPLLEMLKHPHLCGINRLTAWGESLLHRAVRADMEEVALALIAHPEFHVINARDLDGSTVLHPAAKRGMLGVCAAVLQRRDFRGIFAKVEGMTARAVARSYKRDMRPLAKLLEEAEKAYTALHASEL